MRREEKGARAMEEAKGRTERKSEVTEEAGVAREGES